MQKHYIVVVLSALLGMAAAPVGRAADVLPPLPSQAPGAPEAGGTYAEAAARAKEESRDLVVFLHGSDWCRPGEAFRAAVWESEAFRKALGDGLLLYRIDVRESRNEDEKKGFGVRVKGFKTALRTYPALVFVDPAGARYAKLLGDTFPYEGTEAVSAIRDIHGRRERRDVLIARAAEAPPAQRPGLLADALDQQAGARDEILKLLRAADPEDRHGHIARLTFNTTAALQRSATFASKKQFEEGEAWYRKELKRKGLTPHQRQWLHTGLGNLYRRWGGHEAEAVAAFKASRHIDGETIPGRAAYRLSRRFVGPPTLEYGWEPRHCSTEPVVWNIDPEDVIDGPGTYDLTFSFDRGKSGLTIRNVVLLSGGAEITRDEHEGFAGGRPRDTAYHLTVTETPVDPLLRATVLTGPNADSRGRISLARVTDSAE